MSNLPFGLNDAEKFALLAFQGAFVAKMRLDLPSGVRTYTEWPADLLPEHWRRWLGETRLEKLESSNLILVTSNRSERPTILDGEGHFLSNLLALYQWPLGLVRARILGAPVSVIGGVEFGQVQLRWQSERRAFAWPEHYPQNPLSETSFNEADELFQRIRSLEGGRAHRRLFRGLNMLYRCWTEIDPLERMHYCVRSLDALIASEQGKGRKQFIERGELFVGKSVHGSRFLDELYRARSAVVHMHGLETLIAEGEEWNDLAQRIDANNVEAELVATEAYRRILACPSLVAFFETEERISDLWGLPQQQRRCLFGEPIDTTALRAASNMKRLAFLKHER